MSFYPEFDHPDLEKLIDRFQKLPIAGEEDPLVN